MAYVYAFRDVVAIRGAGKLDPQKVGEIIEAITDRDRPTALWKAAKSSRHYLHKCYEWDVQLAAEAHWRTVSENLIRSIYAVDTETHEQKPAFLSIAADDGRSYYHHSEIVGSASLQLALMKGAQRDLAAFQKRYRMLAVICPLIAAAQERIEEALAASASTVTASAA
jgi:hypothetical protein